MKTLFKRAAELPLCAVFFLLYPIAALWGRVSTSRRRASGALPRLLWGVTPILTIATSSRAMRRRGYEAVDLVIRPYHIYARFTVNLQGWARWLPMRLALPFAVFLWALVRFDVIHGFYDGALLAGTALAPLEWRLLRWAGKLSVVAAYGADVRSEASTLALGTPCCCTDCDRRVAYCVCREDQGRARVGRALRDATLCLSMGDMIEYTKGSRNDLFYWPIDLSEWPEVGVPAHDGPVRIVHAANHRMFKGTRFLEAAVAQLRAEGLAVELDIVERCANDEARRRYEAADIVAEQFLIGFFGYFAVEAMALGKPVVTFLRRPEYLPADVPCPLVSATPTTLPDVLRELVQNAERRRELGRAGRRFVEQVFSLEAFGARMDGVYRQLWFGAPATAARPLEAAAQ